MQCLPQKLLQACTSAMTCLAESISHARPKYWPSIGPHTKAKFNINSDVDKAYRPSIKACLDAKTRNLTRTLKPTQSIEILATAPVPGHDVNM